MMHYLGFFSLFIFQLGRGQLRLATFGFVFGVNNRLDSRIRIGRLLVLADFGLKGRISHLSA